MKFIPDMQGCFNIQKSIDAGVISARWPNKIFLTHFPNSTITISHLFTVKTAYMGALQPQVGDYETPV